MAMLDQLDAMRFQDDAVFLIGPHKLMVFGLPAWLQRLNVFHIKSGIDSYPICDLVMKQMLLSILVFSKFFFNAVKSKRFEKNEKRAMYLKQIPGGILLEKNWG